MLHGHGGDVHTLARELCKPIESILDFSSNISPLPLPEGLLSFLKERLNEIHFLPEVDSFELRKALAERYGLEPQDILVGTGTTQWIYSLPKAFGVKKVIIPIPTYSDYEDAAKLCGCEVDFSGPWPDADSKKNEALLKDIAQKASAGSLVYICNPNNPTGRFIPPQDLQEVIGARPNTIWVVDESYAQFAGPDDQTSLLGLSSSLSNLVVLRSFSKIYGIPGLRLGYVAGSRLGSVSGLHELPWAVGRLAQLAGSYLLEHTDELEGKVREFIRKEKESLLREMAFIKGLEPMESSVHFFLVRVLPPWSSSQLYNALRPHGVLVRDCSNFKGLEENYIRIGLRLPEDNKILLRLLDSLLAGKPLSGNIVFIRNPR